MLSAGICGQTESRTEIVDNHVLQMQVESTISDHVLAVSGQLDLFASAESRKQLCENDMFASLLHRSGPLPMANTVKSSTVDQAGEESSADGIPKSVLLDAIYPPPSPTANNGESEPAAEPVVMSTTTKQWLQRINGSQGLQQQLCNTSVRGHVQASGSIRGKSADIIRRIKIVVPESDKIGTVEPLLRVNIRRLCEATVQEEVFGIEPVSSNDMVGTGLMKPCFSPFEPGLCAIATEEHPLQRATAFLMITIFKTHPRIVVQKTAYLEIESHASGLQWLSADEVLVAIVDKLAIVRFNRNDCSLKLVSYLPQMHSDIVRDVQMSNFNKKIISGGYCGNLFVTDIAQFKAGKLNSNGVYDARNAVSSVAWNPGYATVASAVTDAGELHVLDTRIGQVDCRNAMTRARTYTHALTRLRTGQVDRSNSVIRTQCHQSYTHVWTDMNSALLGFGDGSMRLFDIRQPQNCVVQFYDPLVTKIGSIALDPQRRFFATFGNPEFSIWRCAADSHFTLCNHDPCGVSKFQLDMDPFYKNDGAFLHTGGRKNGMFASTDAHGFICLYDANAAEHSSMSLMRTSSYRHR